MLFKAIVTASPSLYAGTITVQDGQVFVSGASCPDKLCMAQGHKSHGGETIVCLPNKLVVSVVGGDGGQTDAVAG